MKNNSVQLKIGTILSYLQMVVSVLISLAYTPVMIQTLGKSEYGLYNTVASTISIMSVLRLGFNSGYIRFYSKYKELGDEAKVSKVNGMFLLIFVAIGIVALTCGLFLSNNLEFVFDTGLTEQEYKLAKKLMVILTINLSVSFPMLVFTSIINAHEKFFVLKSIGILKTVVGPMVTLPLLLMGYRSVAMVIVTTAVALVADGIYLFYTFCILKCKFSFGKIEDGVFKSLIVYIFFIAIELIADQVNWNVDKLLLGRYKGTESVAIYSVGYSLYTYYMMCSTSISDVFTPKIHRAIIQSGDNTALRGEKLTDLLIKVGRIQFLVLCLLLTGIVFFGMPFITKIWAGNGYENSYYVALLLIIPASIGLVQNVTIEMQRALNKHRFRGVLYICMAFFNLLVSFVLCKSYGAIGCAIGTAISLLFTDGILLNIYYKRSCGLDVVEFWRNILIILLGQIPAFFVGWSISRLVNINGIFSFVVCAFMYLLVYCLDVWFLCLNEFEKQLLKRPLKKFLRTR